MSRTERWLATIVGLTDHKLRVAFARTELYEAALTELAVTLDEICKLAEQTNEQAQAVLRAVVPSVVDVEHLDRIHSIRTTAIAARLLAVGRLLRSSTTEGHLLEQTRQHESATLIQRPDGRPLSLGERRALARQPTRAMLDKLMRDPHPAVTRILLSNPRITEEDVVTMAARRPAAPESSVEIARAWAHHARVRMAIVFNPGSPPGVSVPLLVLLVRPELAQVMRAVDLPPVVRATAHELYELRPPLSEVDRPSLIQ